MQYPKIQERTMYKWMSAVLAPVDIIQQKNLDSSQTPIPDSIKSPFHWFCNFSQSSLTDFLFVLVSLPILHHNPGWDRHHYREARVNT